MYGYLMQYLSQPHKWLGQHFHNETLEPLISDRYKSGMVWKEGSFLPCVGGLQGYKNIKCAIFHSWNWL